MSDQLTLWVINVLIHSTVLTASLLLAATMFRRRAAMRYWILCCGLLLVLTSPAISAMVQSRGSSWFALAAPSELAVVSVLESQQKAEQAESIDSVQADSRPAEQSPAESNQTATDPKMGLQLEQTASTSPDSESPIAAALPPVQIEPSPVEAKEPLWLMKWLTPIVAVVSLIWLAGAAVLLLRMSSGWFRLSRILNRAEPIDDVRFQSAFAKACSAVGCRDDRTPTLVASGEVTGPLAAGIGSGYVVLPKHLIASVDLDELADVLVHEVAHIVRRDPIVVLIQNLASALYWPHPLVRLLNRELAKAREEVCDNFVLSTTEASIYSRTLLSLAGLVQRPETIPGSVGFFASRWKLENRVAGLLDEARDRTTFLSLRGWVFVAAAMLTLLATISTGTITIAQTGSEVTNAESKSTSSPMTISGFVEGPGSDPIAGAKIWLAVASHPYPGQANRSNEDGLLRELGTTDDQGRFEFLLDASTRRLIRERPYFTQTNIVATAPNHGLDWMPLKVFEDDPDRDEEFDKLQARIDKSLGDGRFASRALKLRSESKVVRGRFVDVEGRPIQNLKVLVESLQQPDIPRLLKALEMKWKKEVNEALSLGVVELARSELQQLIPPATTDENGEFELHGVGDDQLVELVVDGDRLEACSLFVLGLDLKTVSLPHIKLYPDGAQDVFVGRTFEYAVGPSVPVNGVVTDYDTGKPVAGVLVYVERLFKDESADEVRLRLNADHMRAVTDGNGRFRIDGMPPGEGHVLELVPPKSKPYLLTYHEISLNLGSDDKKRIEIQMKRGIWIEGRVTDKRSGEPVFAKVDYFALNKNPYSLDKLGLNKAWNEDQQRYMTNRDGHYRVLGLPGPGVLLVKSQVPGYPMADGAETIDGYNAAGGIIPTTPYSLPVENWNLLKQIAPAADVTSFDCDLALDAGVAIPGHAVGPTGERIAEFHVLGQSDKELFWGPRDPDGASSTTNQFVVNDYDGKGPRQLFVKTPDEKLVGKYRLEGPAPEEIVVKLEPSVRVNGRLIDSESKLPAPRHFIACQKSSLFSEEYPTTRFSIHWCHSDDEGRFEIKGLLAGLSYEMYTLNERNNRGNEFKIDLTDARPGDVIEIGDVAGPDEDDGEYGMKPTQSDIKGLESSGKSADPGKRPNPLPRQTDSSAINGRVLDPSGKPIVATLWIGGPPRSGSWSQTPKSVTWSQVGKSAADGRFQISIPQSEKAATKPRTLVARIAATADGLGFAWTHVVVGEPTDNVTLQLVEDTPIRGRIVTLDGTPAANVRLDVVSVEAPDSLPASVDIIKNAKLSSGVYTNWPEWSGGSPLTQSVVSDSDGRFLLSGLGSERHVQLQALRDGLAATRLSIVTREKPSNNANGVIAVRTGRRESQYFAEFTHVVEPGRIIRGTVVDQADGKPIPDVRVVEPTSWASRQQPSVTDAEGNFVIRHVPKASEYKLELSPASVSHLCSEVTVLDTTSSEPLDVELTLTPGIQLRGQVVDEVSGQGVQAEIIYNPLFPNDAIEVLGVEDVANPLARIQTEADGSFVIPVLHGPGAISAEVSGEQYAAVLLTEKDLREIFPDGDLEARPDAMGQFSYLRTAGGGQSRGLMGLSNVQAVKLINPIQGGSPGVIKLSLRRSLTVQGEIFDQQGNPVAGVTVVGLGPSPVSMTDEPLETNRFAVTGLLPDSERTLLFLHPERSLGAIVNVKADEPETVNVKLKPTGSVSGSLLNSDGNPITVGYVDMNPDRVRLRTGLWQAEVDGEGRFEIDNILAGEAFSLHARIDTQQMELFVQGDIRVEAVTNSELGSFRQKDRFRFESEAIAEKLSRMGSQP